MKGRRILWIIVLLVGAGAVAFGAGRFFLHRLKSRPNVVIITTDTTRADHLACYGYRKIKTPFIDRVAQEGVLFEEAFSDQPVTLPSHCSIFTGKYPFHHGVRDNSIYRLAEKNLTLAEMLKGQGYVTAAFVSSYILDHQFGLNQGFDLYNDRFLKPKQKGRLPVDRRAVEVSLLASKWLKSNKEELEDRPFFLWLHYYDPHADYDPPAPYREAYPGNPYDGEIAYMDEWIGYVFDILKRLGWWDNTIVVIAGDHGESLGEYGEQTHGIFIYRPTTRVPLIIRYPGNVPTGLRVRERVSTVDIVPTLLDMLRIETGHTFDGRSLIPLLGGEKKGYPRVIYSEAFIPRSFNWSELKGIRQGDYCYIESPKPELFKTKSHEKKHGNLVNDSPTKAEAMRHTLYALLADEGTGKADRVPITDDMIERLKALGYFVGGGQSSKEEEPDTELPDPKERIGLFVLYQRANNAAKDEHYEQAVSLFEAIIEQDPDNPRFLIEFGDLLIRNKDFERAEKHLKHAVTVDARDPRPHYLLGRCYQEWEKVALALASYENATTLNPDHVMAHFHTGLIHIEARQWNQAEEAFLRVKKIRPRDVATLNNLGYIAIKARSDFKAGIDFIQQALNISPHNADVLGSLGWAFHNAGDHKNATSYLEAALSLVPDNPIFLKQLKAVYRASGNQEKLDQLEQREKILNSEGGESKRH